MVGPILALGLGLSVSLNAAPWTSPLQRADAAYEQRKIEPKAREALAEYRALQKRFPQEPDLAWRVAMACQHVGTRFTSSSDEQIRLFAEGRDTVAAFAKAVPNCAPCAFWMAVNMALYGKTVGILKSLFSVGEVRELLEQSAQIDPSYAFGGAYRLLAVIEEKLPGILGGSKDRAKQFYERAIAAAPRDPINYLFLANHWLNEEGEPLRALTLVRKALSQTQPAFGVPESEESFGELQELERKLQMNTLLTLERTGDSSSP